MATLVEIKTGFDRSQWTNSLTEEEQIQMIVDRAAKKGIILDPEHVILPSKVPSPEDLQLLEQWGAELPAEPFSFAKLLGRIPRIAVSSLVNLIPKFSPTHLLPHRSRV